MTIETLLKHVASFGLDPAGREPLDASEEDEPVAHLRAHKLLGLARAATAAGDLQLSRSQELRLETAQRAMAAVILEIDSVMLQFLSELGTEHLILLKGAAHAHLDYPEPSWRDYGDIDLFVGIDRFDEVESWFADRCHQRSFAPFRPAWEREFGKSTTLSDGRIEVDLHRNLSQGLALGVRPASVLAHRTTFELATVDVPALDRSARLVHAALHAMGGSRRPPLSGLSDVARMAQDPDRVRAAAGLAQDWDVGLTFATAIRHASEAVGPVPEPALDAIAHLAGSRNERVRIRILGRPDRSFRHDLVSGLMSVRGARARFTYLRLLAARTGTVATASESE